MAERVIRAGAVIADEWTILGLAPEDTVAEPLPGGPIVVPLTYWKAHREALHARGEAVGVWLKADDEPAELAADAPSLALIAVHFPKFGDGRGYSTGTLLRTRLGYRGELRAFGEIGRDHLFGLKRCGFDSFRLPPHQDPEKALASLRDFSLTYQGAVDDPVPLFRKRLAGIGRLQ